ncbi:MAG: ABC transporter ATP-binding protein [Pseudomonadota bacterium]
MDEDKRIVLELRDVSLRRDRGLLENVRWTVRRGEHWVILGRNGAGKTLLLKIAAGYLWPSHGEVRVLDEQFGQVDLRELRQDIGWVSTALAEKIPGWDTALEVILSGEFATFGLYQTPGEDLIRRARDLMEELGVSPLADQEFKNLSAGEKQRVLLARGRLPRPRLLILDAPFAGLDLAAREKLLALIEKTARDPEGPTMLMVTHRVSEIPPGFTHGLLLKGGKVLASGPLDEIMTDDLLGRTMEIEVRLSRSRGRWRIETA